MVFFNHLTGLSRSAYLRRRFRQKDWLQLRYEDLAALPVKSLRSACRFLEIDFEPEMLQYRSHPVSLSEGIRWSSSASTRACKSTKVGNKSWVSVTGSCSLSSLDG